MSDDRPNEQAVEAHRGRAVATLLALLALAGLAGWALVASFAGGGAKKVAAPSPEAFRAHQVRAHQESTTQTSDHHNQKSDHQKRRAQPPRGTVIRQKPRAGDTDASDNRAGDLIAHEDAGPQWADPTNQKVLGHKKWMATVSDAESEAIEEALDEPRLQPYPIDLKVRRSGVEVAKNIVHGCFDSLRERSPQASGRVIVAFELVADGATARFLNAEIPANVHLEDPDFEDCILGGLSRASFATAEEGTMKVEYPFFFDG